MMTKEYINSEYIQYHNM